MNSECLEAAWNRHPRKDYHIDWGQLCEVGLYDVGVGIGDDDDHYRLSYLAKTYRGPASLVSIATEGMIEDVFGAWWQDNDEEDSDVFNPDRGEAPSVFDFQ